MLHTHIYARANLAAVEAVVPDVALRVLPLEAAAELAERARPEDAVAGRLLHYIIFCYIVLCYNIFDYVISNYMHYIIYIYIYSSYIIYYSKVHHP